MWRFFCELGAFAVVLIATCLVGSVSVDRRVGISRDVLIDKEDSLDSEASQNSSSEGGREQLDECVLFKSNDTYANRVSESYLELGYYDITRDVDISFDVLPDRFNHDGPLFSIGTENFQYYEWKTKAFETQYFVIEFLYSAMSMLMKALNEAHMTPLEICRTYPYPYNIADGQWHFIRARREQRKREPDVWFLSLDDVEINQTVNSRNNVFLQDRPAYLGGRPGYRSSQFRGVIKNFRLKGERIPLRGRATYGPVEVWHCSAPEVRKFMANIYNQMDPRDRFPRPPGRPRPRPPPPRNGSRIFSGRPTRAPEKETTTHE